MGLPLGRWSPKGERATDDRAKTTGTTLPKDLSCCAAMRTGGFRKSGVHEWSVPLLDAQRPVPL
jgi:hypothetical protein